MIIGQVNSDYEPIIRVAIHDSNGKIYERDAVIDTGFDGWLSLPPDIINRLRLNWKRRGRALLSDGSESIFDIYEATVLWDEQLLTIPIDEADSDPLVGMSLMEGYELNIEVINGGIVRLVKLNF